MHPASIFPAEFQFLLGRLETGQQLPTCSSMDGFQFLLGRLETMAIGSIAAKFAAFQFLLGRLETLFRAPCHRIGIGFNSS